jgi:hypothetical protein
MKLKYHFIISALVFGVFYIIGFPLDFVMLAFLASIFMDIDHMTLGRFYGTYNPLEIYNRTMKKELERKLTPKEIILRKWFDLRVFPFHNLLLNIVLLMVILPVGIGVLLHNVLDGFDYFIAAQ